MSSKFPKDHKSEKKNRICLKVNNLFFHNLQSASFSSFQDTLLTLSMPKFSGGVFTLRDFTSEFVMHCTSCSVNTTVTLYYTVVCVSKICTSHGE